MIYNSKVPAKWLRNRSEQRRNPIARPYTLQVAANNLQSN